MTTIESHIATGGFAAIVRDELAELREADEELRARNREAWAAYCKRVDGILASTRSELAAR